MSSAAPSVQSAAEQLRTRLMIDFARVAVVPNKQKLGGFPWCSQEELPLEPLQIGDTGLWTTVIRHHNKLKVQDVLGEKGALC